MFRFLGLLVAVAGFVLASEARGQIVQHRDGQGYSIKVGDTTNHYRNGALWYSEQQIGNTTFKNYSNGTSGMQTQVGPTRFDSFSNPSLGRSKSGFTGPYGTSYQETQIRPFYPSPYYRPYRSPYGW